MSGLAGIGLLARLSGLRRVLGAVPPRAWLALAIALAALLGVLWHHHRVRTHDAAVRSAEDQVWQKKLDAAVAVVKVKDAQLAGISAQLRKANDEANSAIAIDAAALRVSGPGQAACSRIGGIAAASGRSQPASAKPNATGSALPATNGQDMLAAVDWNWLTDRAEEHDQLRAEALSWRAWYAKLLANWPKN